MTQPPDKPPEPPEHQPSSTPCWQPAGGGYPPPPYPYPPPPYPGFAAPPSGPKNGLGIASLVVAIAGLVTALSVIGGVVLGSVAVLLGFLGHARVKRREADNGAVAVAGIVLGALAIVAGIACIFIYVGIWKSVGGSDYVDCMTKAGSDPVLQQQCTDRFREEFENKFSGTLTPGAPSP
ncbi:MAG: DUF4190 domain-containing protein [Mycobacterium sp.]